MPRPSKKTTEKLYFTIGEVADMLKVNTSLIRYWEKEFGNIRPRKNRRGNRLFTAKDIESLKYIYHLVKEQGLTLEGAKKIISSKDSPEENKYKTLHTLQKIRSFLVELKNDL